MELSFSVYYTANDRSGSLTPLASFKIKGVYSKAAAPL